jgi:hypothetical protein
MGIRGDGAVLAKVLDMTGGLQLQHNTSLWTSYARIEDQETGSDS